MKLNLDKKSTNLFLFITLILLSYFLFFRNIINPKFNFWNSDAQIKMYPSQVYLHEKLRSFEFPFWTERVFLGYPIYEDMELGYLNPINLIGNYVFGELNNIKILHFLSYLLGSVCFYFVFKNSSKNVIVTFASILVFYFSFFPINHLIHLNLVLTYLTIPIVLFFAQNFNETKKLRYMVLLGLTIAYGVLWGHLQTVILILIILFLYNLNELGLKKALIYSIISGILSVSFSMHQIYPSFQAFLQSSRTSTDIKYSDFSNFVGFDLTNIFPYILGYYQNFQGSEISGALSIVESYNYLGIVAFIILIFYLIYGSKDKYYSFVKNLIIIYLVLTFKDFSPFLRELEIPVYDNFRYWTRSIILIIVACVFAINHVLSENFSFKKANFKLVFYISMFYIVSFVIDALFFRSQIQKDFWNYLIQSQFFYIKKIEFLIWFILGLLSITFILFTYSTNKGKKYYLVFTFSIVFLIFIDYFNFSSNLIPNRISRFESFKSIKTPESCFNKRCLLLNQDISGYEFLMYQSFGPNGYSQFLSEEYKDFYVKNISEDYRKTFKTQTLGSSELNLETLKDLGFSKVVLKDNQSVDIASNLSFLGSGITENSVSEGAYKFSVSNEKKSEIPLNLKYTPNWQVLVNGNKAQIEKNGIFSKLKVPEGYVEIEIRYFPNDVLIGLAIGFIMLTSFSLTVFFKTFKT